DNVNNLSEFTKASTLIAIVGGVLTIGLFATMLFATIPAFLVGSLSVLKFIVPCMTALVSAFAVGGKIASNKNDMAIFKLKKDIQITEVEYKQEKVAAKLREKLAIEQHEDEQINSKPNSKGTKNKTTLLMGE
ncbi:MAG: hypothetical protein M0R51_00005, partial [Clostridia bacterium]|nr:hypothetical protein [Clostridia bacterium]